MKNYYKLLILFLVYSNLQYASNFEINYKGIKSEHISDYSIVNSCVYKNIFYTSGTISEGNNNYYHSLGTDFSDIFFDKLFDSRGSQITSSFVDYEGNMCNVVKFYAGYEIEIDNILFDTPMPNDVHYLLKYDNSGFLRDTIILYTSDYNETNTSIKNIVDTEEFIFFNLQTTPDGYFNYIYSYEKLSKRTRPILEIYNDGNFSDVILKNYDNELYISISSNNFKSINTANDTYNYDNSCVLFKYSIAEAIINESPIEIKNSEFSYNKISDFIIKDSLTYLTGFYDYEFSVQNTFFNFEYPPVDLSFTSNYIIKINESGTPIWFNQIISPTIYNQNNNSKIIATNENIYLASNFISTAYYTQLIGNKYYTFSGEDQKSLYVAQINISDGVILTSEIFNTNGLINQTIPDYGEIGYINLHELVYDENENSIYIYTNSPYSIKSSNDSEFNEVADFTRISFKNFTPKMVVNDWFDENNMIKAFAKCKGEEFDVSIDIWKNIYHPSEPIENLRIDFIVPENIRISDLDAEGFITILEYEKVQVGFDTISVTVSDGNITKTGYIYLYEIDPPIVTWNESEKNRCFGNEPSNEPHTSVEYIFPEGFETNDVYNFSQTAFLGTEYWYSSDFAPGEYDALLVSETYIYTQNYNSFFCIDSISNSGYTVNLTPTNILAFPDTICVSDWLEVYTSIPDGQFSIDYGTLINTLYESLSDNSYYYNMPSGSSEVFTYDVFDENTGCYIEERTDSIFIKEAPSSLLIEEYNLNFCDYDDILSTFLNSADSDSLRWYSDIYREVEITNDEIFNTNSRMQFFVSQTYRGCESIPKDFYVNPSPKFNFLGDTILCKDENYTNINIEVLDADFGTDVSIYYDWKNIENSEIVSTNDFASLQEGRYLVSVFSGILHQYVIPPATQGETLETICISEKTLNIIKSNITPPIVNDTVLVYGSRPPVLYAIGDSIRWYNMNEILLAEGNTINTGFRQIGDHKLLVSQTAERCESEYDTVTVSIIECNATAPTMEWDTMRYCSNQDAFIIEANETTVRWFDDETKQNQLSDSSTVVFSNLLPGEYSLYASNYNEVQACYGATKEITLVILPSPNVRLYIPEISNNSDTLELMQFAYPQGGTFTGEYVINNMIYTSEAGIGTHEVMYEYTNIHNCTDSASAVFEISSGEILAQRLSINIDTLILTINEEYQIIAQLYPSNTSNTNTYWEIDNQEIVSISETGYVRAISEGETKIYTRWLQNNMIGDSIILIVNMQQSISFELELETVCSNSNPFLLTSATPQGGEYFGDAIINNIFFPQLADYGNNLIGYTYTDSFENTDTVWAEVFVVIPSLPIVENLEAIENYPIAPLSAEGDSVLWYSDILLNNLVGHGNIFNHNIDTEGIYNFYITNIENGCESQAVNVQLKINPCLIATPSINNRVVVQCDNITDTLGFRAYSSHEIYWYNSADSLISTGSEFYPNIDVFGTYTFIAKSFDGNCYSLPQTVQYTYAQAPETTINYIDTVILGNIFSAYINLPEIETYNNSWKINNLSFNGDTLNYMFEETGTYILENTITNTQTACYSTWESPIYVINEYIPVREIAFAQDTLKLYTGFSSTPEINITPTHASNTDFVISISDTSILNISDNTIFGIREGETMIYVQSLDNMNTDSCLVIVEQFHPVTSINIPNSVNIILGRTMQIDAHVEPANATIQDIIFEEKSDNFISVNADGFITTFQTGISSVRATTPDGLVYAECIVVVLDIPTTPTSIEIPETYHLVVNSPTRLPLIIHPHSATTENLIWEAKNAEFLNIASDGLIHPLMAGSDTIIVTDTSTGLSATSVVRITNTHAPMLYHIPIHNIKQAGDSITIDISIYAYDDETPRNMLGYDYILGNYTQAIINETILTIKTNQNDYIGRDTIRLSIRDEEGSVAWTNLIINITEKENEAPEISNFVINIPFATGNTQVNLTDFVYDDFTNSENIIWEANADTSLFEIELTNSILTIYSKNREWYGTDSIFISATDEEGLVSIKYIKIEVSDKPNEAPIILPIPNQYNNDTLFFGIINLNNYVSDDYTNPSDIVWRFSPSININISNFNNYIFPEIASVYWCGAEHITFTAIDQDGEKDSVEVLFVQEQVRNINWRGLPIVNFIANKTYSTPNDTITLYASLTGASSWKWEIEGVNLSDSSLLIQKVVFPKPGTYTVKLTAINSLGIETLEKTEYITIYGIEEREPAICIGESTTLSVNNLQLDSYLWNTGDAIPSITVNPNISTQYSVTITNGLFTFVDQINLRVSVPVDLGKDSAICDQSTYNLYAGEYESYIWSNGSTNSNIDITNVGQYSITVTDDIECESTDTFSVTGINPLPYLNLGNDTTLCSGDIIVLDGGIGYSYDWNNGYNGQQIIIDTTSTIALTITDNNRCSSTDSINITFQYPYTEQIGIVTFSEISKNIIIAWEKTTGANIMKYQVYRESNIRNTWSLVQEVDFDEIAVVEDSLSNYLMRPYRYVLVSIDSCGNSSANSIAHRSMHLQTSWSADEHSRMNLRWTAYEPIDSVETYIILRGEDPNNLMPIDSMPSDYTQWSDIESNKNMHYRVLFRLNNTIYLDRYNSLKSESGPFSQALSNIAELTIDDTKNDEIKINADIIVFPTLITDAVNIYINSEIKEEYDIELINSLGKIIEKYRVNTKKDILKINTTNIPEGIYNVNITTTKGTKSVQIVK